MNDMVMKLKNYLVNVGWKRFVFMVLGVTILGVGVALLRFSSFGTDPYSCMTIGVSNHLPISYGTFQLILNLVIFVPIVIMYPKSFGVGALINMLALGYIVDFCMFICSLFSITIEGFQDNLIARILLLIAGVVVMCFGIALYMECDLGIASYDMVAQLIEDKTNKKIMFRWARVSTDMICMTIGFLVGGTVGIATFVVGFFTGPVVSFFRNIVKNTLL